MNREDIRKKIDELGIVAAVREHTKEAAQFAGEAVAQGGIPVVEVSLTTPGAVDVIAYLAKAIPDLIVGAGSVLNVQLAQASLDAGARFLTSDARRLDLVEFAVKKDIVVF